MPMVPTFQGNVPTVDDAGNRGSTPFAQLQPSDQYQRTFQAAMATAKDIGSDMTKLALTEAARRTKAESDDAEVQAMDIIQRYTLDPDTGYFNQRGKNAVDTYEKTREGMTKDLNALVGSLSPQVREAVSSRIMQRAEAANGQMMRWKGAQQDAYFLDSSQSRASALVSSAANDYANEVALGKTRASLQQEVAYQAQLLGWSPETMQEQLRKSNDLLEATRFQAWGADDPMGALAALQANKGTMSADIYQALNTKVFAQAKDQLAATVAQRLPRNMTKQQLADWLRNPNTRTGIPVVDSLSPANRAQVLSNAFGFVERDRAASQAAVKESLDNDIAEARANGFASNEKAPDYFVSKYGQEQGAQMYEKYKYSLDVNSAMHDMFTAPDQSIDMWVAASKPEAGDPNFAAKIKNYNALLEAGQKIKAARLKDPMGYVLAVGIQGYSPIDWSQSDWDKQLTFRVQHAKDREGDFGSGLPLSKQEFANLQTVVNSLDSYKAAGFIQRVANAIGEDGATLLGRQASATNGAEDFELPFKIAADPAMQGTLPTILSGQAAKKDGQAQYTAKPRTGDAKKDADADPLMDLAVLMNRDRTQQKKEYAAMRMYYTGLINDPNAPLSREQAIQKTQEAFYGTPTKYRGATVPLRDRTLNDVDYSLTQAAQSVLKNNVTLYTLKTSTDASGKTTTQAEPVGPKGVASELMKPDGNGAQLARTNQANVFNLTYGPDVYYQKVSRDGKTVFEPYTVTINKQPRASGDLSQSPLANRFIFN